MIERLFPKWPRWDGVYFRTQNLRFVSGYTEKQAVPSQEVAVIHKPKSFIDLYCDLLRGRDIRAIVELGYLHGGMPLFLADMHQRAKVVAVDRRDVPVDAVEMAKANGLSRRVIFYGNTDQDDKERLRAILDHEFGDEPLDLITDDASHLYEQTKASFEACFGYLKPGGHYVIEDWAWAHWQGPMWQSPKNQFAGKTPLSTLLFELTATLASNRGMIARIEIPSGAFAVITRGSALPHKATFDLSSSYLTAGRKFVGFT